MFSDNSFLLITDFNYLFTSNVLSLSFLLVISIESISMSKLSPLFVLTLESLNINTDRCYESSWFVSMKTAYNERSTKLVIRKEKILIHLPYAFPSLTFESFYA